MGISTQLTLPAAVQDPSPGNAATTVVSNVDEPNQDYPLLAFSEVCLRVIPGVIQLVTEINPYSRWSTCSLSLGTWVQIPKAHRKSGAVLCICILSVSMGGLGLEIGDSWEAQGPTGDSVSRRTEREKKWLDCPMTSTKSHDLQGPHNYCGIQASAHILGLLLSLSCFPQQVLKQNLKQKSAFPFRDQNSRSKHRFALWSVNITVFFQY